MHSTASRLSPEASSTKLSCWAWVSLRRKPKRVWPNSKACSSCLRAIKRSGVCLALSSLLYE
eukprot:gene26331-47611_t